MPAAIGIPRRPPSDCAKAASASRRPCVAWPMAAGRAALRLGTYSGPRTRPSTVSRVSVRRSLRSVSGWRSDTERGSEANQPRQRSRNWGSRAAQALSASQAVNSASSAAWLSVENEAGRTMSGGATPSITARRTRAGNRRWYSNAARVP